MTNSKQQKIDSFDASAIGTHNGHLYGLPFEPEECETVVIPVPWEVTTSYGGGTAQGPQAILKASTQVDLLDPVVVDAWKMGVGMLSIDKKIIAQNNTLKKKAKICIKHLENGGNANDAKLKKTYDEVNLGCARMNTWLKNKSSELLAKGYNVAVLGGEHSTPLGLIQALAQTQPGFSVLHFDAHADIRRAYEGFDFSHASIMYNVSQTDGVANVTHVGIRDYCEEEADRIKNSNGKNTIFTDREIKNQMFEGKTWQQICSDIIATLKEKIYISFDIDALNPTLCPHTGTPVPGGLELEQVYYLFEALLKSGKKVIGCDLTEVAPGDNEWDAAVGARILWRLTNLMNASNH